MFLTNFSSEDSPYRPSFFEMVAQDRLMSGLKPALKYVFNVLAQRHPWFESCVKYNEEIFHSVMYVLERHFLREHDGSFAENFYGLKRVRLRERRLSAPPPFPATTSASPSPSASSTPRSAPTAPHSKGNAANELSNRDRSRALFFLVAVPYFKSVLDQYYHQLTSPTLDDGFENPNVFDPTTEESRPPIPQFVRRVFHRYYRYFHAIYEGTLFIYQIRYLFSLSQYFSPFLHLTGQKVQRMSAEDMKASEQPSRELDRLWSDSTTTGFWGNVQRVFSRVAYVLASYAKWGLLVGIFLFKFLEWWYSSENRLQPSRVLPVPPPPDEAQPVESFRLPRSSKDCGLCLRPRTNATATPDGFVFCYPCVFNYVTSHKRAPATHLPCTVDQLRKIYET